MNEDQSGKLTFAAEQDYKRAARLLLRAGHKRMNQVHAAAKALTRRTIGEDAGISSASFLFL
jgi:hypothetical protein